MHNSIRTFQNCITAQKIEDWNLRKPNQICSHNFRSCIFFHSQQHHALVSTLSPIGPLWVTHWLGAKIITYILRHGRLRVTTVKARGNSRSSPSSRSNTCCLCGLRAFIAFTCTLAGLELKSGKRQVLPEERPPATHTSLRPS